LLIRVLFSEFVSRTGAHRIRSGGERGCNGWSPRLSAKWVRSEPGGTVHISVGRNIPAAITNAGRHLSAPASVTLM